MKKIQSTCNYCAIDCNLDFYVENNRIVKVVPTKGYPVNDGFSCIKGLSLDKQQKTVKPNSLPKIRQEDGSFKEVSWDEGFKHVANKLKEIQAKYGAESVAGISTGQLTMEEFVKAYTLERGAAGTGLSEEQILEFVELIHAGKKVSFWWTMGVNQGYEAVRTAQAIINIALMTGNIGKPGTGANSITGQCNAMASRAYSNTAVFYGGGDFTNPARRARIAEVFGIDESKLAEKPTKTYNQIIEGINAGEIKGLWILCTNPRHSWTNNETFATAAKKLELFVVQDIYDTIESAEDCTVYFPVVPGIKKEGTYINLERRLSAMRPVLERGENEISDYEAILGVGKALGMGDELKGWETPKDCFNLMRECSRNMPCDITGITWEMLENSHGIQWPYPEGKEEENKDEQRRLYSDGKFFTPSKKANFMFEEVRENPLPTTEEFPLVLNTGRGSVGQWHTQSRTKEVKFVEDVSAKKAYLYMNTKMAAENDIKEMEQIRVYSVNGQDAVFAVKITDNVQYNELYAPIHYIECNKLTPSLYDSYSKEPSYKATPVRFEKYEEA